MVVFSTALIRGTRIINHFYAPGLLILLARDAKVDGDAGFTCS